ncbi:Nucleosome assembly protein 1 [Taenia solium]|eukprot:TsM_000250100 transcript=TsM_000250100 gene=TsM_000250100
MLLQLPLLFSHLSRLTICFWPLRLLSSNLLPPIRRREDYITFGGIAVYTTLVRLLLLGFRPLTDHKPPIETSVLHVFTTKFNSLEESLTLHQAQEDLLLLLDAPYSSQIHACSPKEVKAGVDALKTLFKKRASIYSEYLKELYALEFKYARLYAPIYLQQRAIVTGKNMEEVEEDEPPANQKTLGDAEPDASLGSAFGLGIPGYWARVLRSAPLMRNYLTEIDLEILQYLEGIRYSFSKKLSSPGFRLVFMFKQNPFFNDNVLMKQFSLKFIDQCEDLNEFGPTKVISTKASQIDWTSGHEPTGDVVVPPKDSFFNLFRDLQPESPDTLEYAQLMEDYDICVYIRDRVLPYAVYWFTGEMIQA